MSKKTKTTIFDFETISRPIEAEAKYQKSEISSWENDTLLIFLAFGMAIIDMSFLFNMMDLVMDQNQWLGKIGALAIALILNLLPLPFAKFVNKARYGLDRHAKIFAIVCAVVFVAVYGWVVFLRFNCLELYTSTVSNELINTAASTPVAVDAVANTVSTRRAIATAGLLSVEPLATSVFSCIVAVTTDDPLKKKINFLKMRKLELKAADNRISTAIASMWEDKDFMMECDREQYEAARDLVAAEAGRLKTEARMMLAERLKDPSSMTKLAQDDTETDLPETGKIGTEKEKGSDPSMRAPKKAAA